MKWFKHFSNAHDNNDLTKIRMKFGADGYAIYWYCLELVASDLGTTEEISFELKHDCEVIGFNLKVDSQRVEEIILYMVNLGLFTRENDKILCKKLGKYLDKRTTRNKKIIEIIEAYAGKSPALPETDKQLSETNPVLSETVRDCPSSCSLDTDTDTELNQGNLPNQREISPKYINTTTGEILGGEF